MSSEVDRAAEVMAVDIADGIYDERGDLSWNIEYGPALARAAKNAAEYAASTLVAHGLLLSDADQAVLEAAKAHWRRDGAKCRCEICELMGLRARRETRP